MMHGFNSVSGMWSDSQVKGRGGRGGGEGTNEEGIETEEEEGHGAEGDGSAGERVWGWHSSTFTLVYGLLGNGGAPAVRRERRVEETDGKEGPVWLLSASHVSKPVLKNE